MIGDTSFDMLMARSAGVRAVGVNWGYHAPAELIVSGAISVADSAAALEQGGARRGAAMSQHPREEAAEALARQRFVILNVLRFTGIAMLMFGLAIARRG